MDAMGALTIAMLLVMTAIFGRIADSDFKNTFRFTGRIGRSQFVAIWVPIFLAGLAFSWDKKGSFQLLIEMGSGAAFLFAISSLTAVYVYFCAIIKRLNDIGKPRRLSFIAVIPFIGLVFLIYLTIANEGESVRQDAPKGNPEDFRHGNFGRDEKLEAEDVGEEERDTSQTGKLSNSDLVNDEKYYGTILGLKGRITPEDIKQAYRELVKQYHPDLVSHLGPKLKELAEHELKKINEAYAFFRDKYGIT